MDEQKSRGELADWSINMGKVGKEEEDSTMFNLVSNRRWGPGVIRTSRLELTLIQPTSCWRGDPTKKREV